MNDDGSLCIKRLGFTDYAPVLEAMQRFTVTRNAQTPDEIWLLEHPPVFTLGLAGNPVHLLQNPAGIDLIHIDRGGQITYHGPGQLVVYLLVDLPRRRIKIREFVHLIEESIIATLAGYGLQGERKRGAPGVYIDGVKIAALGLRVKNGRTYHGLALNVNVDLTPFSWINPCGYADLKSTRLADFDIHDDVDAVGSRLLDHLQSLLPPFCVAAAGTA
ncbi:MAG: lipoyl(octanoyl) transferase LipB [Azoarcus sp.]|jgi:lipoyl(octanoyl) transferase|nr:lipoyl(octanoyl) transferase LipB [Azoarcus sp.]